MVWRPVVPIGGDLKLVASERGDSVSADHPGVLIRPPRLYLAGLIFAFALDAFWPLAIFGYQTNSMHLYVAGGLLAILGLALGLTAVRALLRAGTNVPTPQPATAIVATGPYRLSRNPIYVGLTILFIGIMVATDNAWGLALLCPMLVVMHFGVVLREERYLAQKFGEVYLSYKATTRRWL